MSMALAGQRVALEFNPNDVHVFDAQGLALPRTVSLLDQPLAWVP